MAAVPRWRGRRTGARHRGAIAGQCHWHDGEAPISESISPQASRNVRLRRPERRHRRSGRRRRRGGRRCRFGRGVCRRGGRGGRVGGRQGGLRRGDGLESRRAAAASAARARPRGRLHRRRPRHPRRPRRPRRPPSLLATRPSFTAPRGSATPSRSTRSRGSTRPPPPPPRPCATRAATSRCTRGHRQRAADRDFALLEAAGGVEHGRRQLRARARAGRTPGSRPRCTRARGSSAPRASTASPMRRSARCAAGRASGRWWRPPRDRPRRRARAAAPVGGLRPVDKVASRACWATSRAPRPSSARRPPRFSRVRRGRLPRRQGDVELDEPIRERTRCKCTSASANPRPTAAGDGGTRA